MQERKWFCEHKPLVNIKTKNIVAVVAEDITRGENKLYTDQDTKAKVENNNIICKN